jgi:hypothetical protein
MDYKLSENIEMSAYEATLTFDENVNQYANSENFEVRLYDLYTNTTRTINYNEFPGYGITNTDSDLANRAKKSFYDHNGLLMYFDGPNKFYFKQLLLSKSPENAVVGFHSSEITIYFSDDKVVTFNSILLPKIVRNEKIVQVDSSLPDPVLSASNLRQEFDYNKPVDPDYLNRVVADYDPGDTNGIYVNTFNNDTNVPCYYSQLSAFTDTVFTEYDPIELSEPESYIYDETTNEKYDIYYTSGQDSPKTSVFEFADGYNTELVYYEFNQYLSADDGKLHKNKLVFNLNVNGVPAPEILEPLQIEIISNPDSGILSKSNNTGTMHVIVYNPNINYRDTAPNIVITGNPTTVSEYEYDKDTGYLEFDMTVSFGDVKSDEIDSNYFLNRTITIMVTASLDDDIVEPVSAQKIWRYKKTPLNKLDIKITDFQPPTGILTNQQTGSIKFKITNSNSDFIITEDNTKIELHDTLGIHDDEEITVNIDDSTENTIIVEYGNISILVGDDLTLHLEAGIYDTNDDWDATEVKEQTWAESDSRKYTKRTINLQPLKITYSDYESNEPPAYEDGVHWLTNDRDDSDYPQIGYVLVTIYNPNEDYRDSDKILCSLTNVPRNAAYQFSDSSYSSNGKCYFTINGVELTRTFSATSATTNAYLTYDFSEYGYDESQVRLDTEITKDSELWKYKVIKPDIYPYDDFARFSLYCLSDLTLNGGKIGSKDIACKNLTVENQANVYSDVYVASGCSVTCNATNTFHGTLHTQNLYVNNPNHFEDAVYISENLIAGGGPTTIPSAYIADGCHVELNNGSIIENRYEWSNPTFPTLSGIPTEPVIVGTEDVYGARQFGINGAYTAESYRNLNVGNNVVLTFYPGKYYFDSINLGVDCTFDIHNDESTETEDKSVMIYTNNFQAGDRFKMNQDSNGPFDFRLYYGGIATASIGTQGYSMAGTIIAPSGTVRFNNFFTWVGHVWAKEVYLANGASIDNNNT